MLARGSYAATLHTPFQAGSSQASELTSSICVH
jgi:hypothetical protein